MKNDHLAILSTKLITATARKKSVFVFVLFDAFEHFSLSSINLKLEIISIERYITHTERYLMYLLVSKKLSGIFFGTGLYIWYTLVYNVYILCIPDIPDPHQKRM